VVEESAEVGDRMGVAAPAGVGDAVAGYRLKEFSPTVLP
jgi:hypothetical protein